MATSPFPGFNPWFETVWGTAHHLFISSTYAQIRSQLPPPFKARIEQDILIVGESELRRAFPDVHVSRSPGAPTTSTAKESSTTVPELILLDEGQPHSFIEIVDGSSGDRIVSVIEVLSPANKLDGQALYVRKQEDLRAAGVNLVEIDWLRKGRPTTIAARQRGARLTGATPHVSVYRSAHPTTAELYRLSMRGTLPTAVSVPIESTLSCRLDLQAVCDSVTALLGLYGDEYAVALEPTLEPDDHAWAQEQIRSWLALNQ